MQIIENIKYKFFKNSPENKFKKSIKIFLIDDQYEFLLLVEQFLKNQLTKKSLTSKYHVEIFKYTSASDAINAITLGPDIILLDYYLHPNHNGDTAYKYFKVVVPNAAIIMISGLEDSRIVHQLIQQGIRNYIIKDDEVFNNLLKILIDQFQLIEKRNEEISLD